MLDNIDNMVNGLTDSLKNVFESVSRLDCIKGLFLCGGTAQSIQMNHRLSEDLDFELIGIRRERPELDFEKVIKELQQVFPGAKVEILGEDHFQVFVGDRKSKLSFYRPDNPVKYIHEGFTYNNIVTPSLQDLLGMKLYTICLRTRTRDFYDIYCLLENGCSLKEGISYASYLSRHSFKSKDMLSKLLAPKLYPINDEFLKLQPRKQITSEQMLERFRAAIQEEDKALSDINKDSPPKDRSHLERYKELEQKAFNKALSQKKEDGNEKKSEGYKR